MDRVVFALCPRCEVEQRIPTYTLPFVVTRLKYRLQPGPVRLGRCRCA